MKDVKVDRLELIEKLKDNRDKHKAIFLEAQQGFRKLAIEHLEQMLEDARNGKKIARGLSLAEPMNQTREYNRAIAMLEMSKDDLIVLSEHDFQCYVLDDWAWKRNFLASNSSYSMTAASEYQDTNGDDIDF